MFNYPFYTNPSYYTPGMGSAMLGGNAAFNTAAASGGAGGLLKGLASKWSWNGFLTSTGKTLNVINQAIPIFYQVRPIVQNARTMFRVLGAVKGSPNKVTPSVQEVTRSESKGTPSPSETTPIVNNIPSSEEGNPTFFL